jgi:hypothetical protein
VIRRRLGKIGGVDSSTNSGSAPPNSRLQAAVAGYASLLGQNPLQNAQCVFQDATRLRRVAPQGGRDNGRLEGRKPQTQLVRVLA